MSKRFELLCAALAFTMLPLTSGSGAELQHGAKAGLTLADQEFNYYIDIERNIDWRSGAALGAFAELPVMTYLGIRLEGLYIQKGYKEEIHIANEALEDLGTCDLHYRVDMLTLNLLARGILPTGTYALAGPRLDIRLSTDADFVDEALENLENDYKSTLFGLTLGVGQEFRLMKAGTIFVEGQYYHDIDKLYDRKPGIDEITTLKSIKNRSSAFFAGMRF